MDDGPLTITAAADLIRAGKLSPIELLDICLRRIDRYEPRVKAWVYLDRDRARSDAEKLTTELAEGQNRGPLHGIPIGVKDIIDVFDMPTGCGSKLWANSYARRDATVVERLRQAGAVILGKTVTTPFAYLDPPPTRNPWNLDRTPGGSSSGSAAAVACGMCLGALGTQTGGSITRPASFCGVCSLKPTHGLLSTDGVLPLAPLLDHVGIMANSVADLRTLWGAFGLQREQPAAESHYGNMPDDLAGRIDPEMTAAFASFRDRAGAADVRSNDLRVPDGFPDIRSRHRIVMADGAARYHASRVARHPDDYPPRIAELIHEGLGRSPGERSFAAQALRADRQRLGSLTSPLFPDAGHVLAGPATPGPAPDTSTTGDPVCQVPWSYLGVPTVSFPIAKSRNGLPLAVQLVGSAEDEGELLVAASELEAAAGFDRELPPVS
jgi:aspartyl-tRNA(Asn)/glutamyl-tRNA(Gln) amidotransferase subunit A